MNSKYDVIIVGTGAAGLFCALNFPETKKICIITKRGADESYYDWTGNGSSRWKRTKNYHFTVFWKQNPNAGCTYFRNQSGSDFKVGEKNPE